MAVTLSGLPCTLAPQRWDKWKAEFKVYVTASGLEQKPNGDVPICLDMKQASRVVQ